jgi:hypothetical protein
MQEGSTYFEGDKSYSVAGMSKKNYKKVVTKFSEHTMQTGNNGDPMLGSKHVASTRNKQMLIP